MKCESCSEWLPPWEGGYVWDGEILCLDCLGKTWQREVEEAELEGKENHVEA